MSSKSEAPIKLYDGVEVIAAVGQGPLFQKGSKGTVVSIFDCADDAKVLMLEHAEFDGEIAYFGQDCVKKVYDSNCS